MRSHSYTLGVGTSICDYTNGVDTAQSAYNTRDWKRLHDKVTRPRKLASRYGWVSFLGGRTVVTLLPHNGLSKFGWWSAMSHMFAYTAMVNDECAEKIGDVGIYPPCFYQYFLLGFALESLCLACFLSGGGWLIIAFLFFFQDNYPNANWLIWCHPYLSKVAREWWWIYLPAAIMKEGKIKFC